MLVLSLTLAVILASPAVAQVSTGRIDVTLEDATGGRLRGATVAVTGPITQTQTTDAQGQAHFLNLPTGRYTVRAAASGFTPFDRGSVDVTVGGAVSLDLKLASTGAAVTTRVTVEELQGLPSARDPWVVLQTTPTVYVDRVNVGGSESGRQSSYNGKGAADTDNTWAIDGVPVTDMGSTGSSSFHYHFDSLQEMAITTGGADTRHATGGVHVNLVVKSAANTPHGGASGYVSNDVRYVDRGFDLGGAIVRDRLWAWGQLAQTDTGRRTPSGAADDTIFKTRSFKLDGQAHGRLRGNFTFYDNNPIQVGLHAGPTRPPETTWNRTGPGGGGARYFKGEAHLVAGRRLLASVKVAEVKGGFLHAAAGGDRDFYRDASGVWHDSYYNQASDRPQHYVGGDGHVFTGRHDVRFGASWRSNSVVTTESSPASRIRTLHDQIYPRVTVEAARDASVATDATYVSAYLADTMSRGRLTVTGAVRVDRQTAGLGASSIPGVTGIAILPAVSAPAVPGLYAWHNVTPRVGAAYGVDRARKTIVRASYARFASQLPGTQATLVSPIQPSYAYYNAVDRNGDRIAQVSEILFSQGLQGFAGFDPFNPALSSVNRIDPNTKAPTTHEVLAGAEREVMPATVVSAAVTWRMMSDLLWEPLIGVTSADYISAGTLSGTLPLLGAYSAPLFALRPAAVPVGGGRYSTNRAGYQQRYVGLELQLTRRMSGRFMARVGFSTNRWTEHFDNPLVSIIDPTKAPAPNVTARGRPFAGPQIDAGAVVRAAPGSGQSDIYMVAPRYQLVANGLYRVGRGLSAGVNLVTREGYAEPFFRSRVLTGDPLGVKTVLIAPAPDAFRLPAATSFDTRVEWRRTWAGRYGVALDLDVFNVFNAETILGREYDARFAPTSVTGFGNTIETMNPRVARLGVRFTF